MAEYQTQRLSDLHRFSDRDNHLEYDIQRLLVLEEYRVDTAVLEPRERPIPAHVLSKCKEARLSVVHLWSTTANLCLQGKSPCFPLHFDHLNDDVLLVFHENDHKVPEALLIPPRHSSSGLLLGPVRMSQFHLYQSVNDDNQFVH